MFKQINISEIKSMQELLRKAEPKACEFSAGNNILWDFEKELEYTVIMGRLVYRMQGKEQMRFFIPDLSGEIGEIIERIQELATAESKKMYLGIMSEEIAKKIDQLFPGRYKIDFDRDHSDYLYLVEDMAQLKGKKFHRKKNHLNGFIKNFEFTYEPIDERNLEECREMNKRWLTDKLKNDESFKESLLLESGAIEFAFDHYNQFGFMGGLIRINDQVEAFTFGEPLNRDTFLVHVEKANEQFRGLYTAITQQFAQRELSDYTYINREEDMGIEGLRQSKLSFYPVEIYHKYYMQEI